MTTPAEKIPDEVKMEVVFDITMNEVCEHLLSEAKLDHLGSSQRQQDGTRNKLQKETQNEEQVKMQDEKSHGLQNKLKYVQKDGPHDEALNGQQGKMPKRLQDRSKDKSLNGIQMQDQLQTGPQSKLQNELQNGLQEGSPAILQVQELGTLNQLHHGQDEQQVKLQGRAHNEAQVGFQEELQDIDLDNWQVENEGSIQSGDCRSLESTAIPEQYHEIQIMVAGLSRTGKSTVLNNIFQLTLKAKRSASASVTTKVQQYTYTDKKRKINVKVIDTPGLKATDVNESIVLLDMKERGLKNGFLLMLTYPVHAAAAVTQDFKNMLQNLTSIFGASLWDWCIILLTHSDTLRCMDFPNKTHDQEYLKHLKDTCSVLQKVLENCGIQKKVKIFTDYKSEKEIETKGSDIITAIPVGKQVDKTVTKDLFPHNIWMHQYEWPDLAFMEIVSLKDTIPKASFMRTLLIQLKYGKHILGSKASTIAYSGGGGSTYGLVAGAGAGAAIGLSGGPVGILVGISTGAAIGFITGLLSTTGAAIAGSVGDHYSKISKERVKISKEKLKENTNDEDSAAL